MHLELRLLIPSTVDVIGNVSQRTLSVWVLVTAVGGCGGDASSGGGGIGIGGASGMGGSAGAPERRTWAMGEPCPQTIARR